MQTKKRHLEPYIEQWTGSKLANEYVKAVCCHPDDLTYIQTHEMLDWMKHKLESRLPGEKSTTSDMQVIDTTLRAESEEKLRSLLMKVKEETEKLA